MFKKLTYSEANNMTNDQLIAFVEGVKVLAVDVVETLSIVLSVMKSRKMPSVLFDHVVLKFWESISEGTLSAEAAILLGNQELIRAILPLPVQEQIEIANGKEVYIASRDSLGDIKAEYLPINRMGAGTLKRAFGPQGIRSFKAQSEMIRAAGRVERVGRITLLRDERVLKFGNSKFTRKEIMDAAKSMGWVSEPNSVSNSKAA